MPLIAISYKRLHYTDYPPASDITKGTIVCHHGLGSSQSFYTPIVPRLTQAGFRVITFDASGAGRSSYTQVEQSVGSLAGDVLGLLDALSVEGKVIMAGHSMGGMVVTHLAAEHKDRIQAIVLIGPVYPSDGVSKVFEKRIETVEREGSKSSWEKLPDVTSIFLLTLVGNSGGHGKHDSHSCHGRKSRASGRSVHQRIVVGPEQGRIPVELSGHRECHKAKVRECRVSGLVAGR